MFKIKGSCTAASAASALILCSFFSLPGSGGGSVLTLKNPLCFPQLPLFFRRFSLLLSAYAADLPPLGKAGDPLFFTAFPHRPDRSCRRLLAQQDQGNHQHSEIDQPAADHSEGPVKKTGKPASRNSSAETVIRTEMKGLFDMKGHIQ